MKSMPLILRGFVISCLMKEKFFSFSSSRMLFLFPVISLSMQTTLYPLLTRSLHSQLPMNPEPPATRTVFFVFMQSLSVVGRRYYKPVMRHLIGILIRLYSADVYQVRKFCDKSCKLVVLCKKRKE